MTKTSENKTMLTREEVLMNEDALLQGLIEAGNFKNDEELQSKIEIKRGGKKFFEFIVRPLNEEDIGECRRNSTKRFPNPNGRNLPPIEGQTDWVKFRSWKIYLATLEEDRKKLWDNKKAKDQFGVLTGVDMIDEVLMSGEKDRISDEIDRISGQGQGNDMVLLEEYAKN